MKKTFLVLLLFFCIGISPQKTFAACCDFFAVKIWEADLAALALATVMKNGISLSVVGQGQGIQGAFKVLGDSLSLRIASISTHITGAFATQSDVRREAEFKVAQALNKQFGLGLNPCCEVGNGIAAGTKNGQTYLSDLTQGMSQQTRFKSGRESVNFKKDVQKVYGEIPFIEPKGMMYTPEEREAAQNVYGGLADMFPPVNLRKTDRSLSESAQADYDGILLTRQWMLEGARMAPLSSWIVYHSPIIPAEEWLKAYQERTGLHHSVKTENRNLSPKAIMKMKADEALSVASNEERLNLNKKGLYIELLKLYSEQYSVDVELLTTVKRLPVQLALQNKEVLKEFNEYFESFKIQLKR